MSDSAILMCPTGGRPLNEHTPSQQITCKLEWDRLWEKESNRRFTNFVVAAVVALIAFFLILLLLPHVIRAIWGFDSDEKVVTFRGKFYSLEGAHPGPRPHHRIGIWLGAMGPRMLNLLGCLGDGWVAPLQSYLPTSKLLDAQRVIDASAVSTGRSPTSIRRGRNISGIIDDEGKYGKSLRGQGEAVVGSVDDWVEELAYYYNDLRIDSFIFWPAEEGKEVDQVSLFADKVVPRVKESLDR